MIGVVGISYKTAPIKIRELISFSSDETEKFLKLLKINDKLQGAVLLSTCNRTEVYYQMDDENSEQTYDYIIKNLTYFKNCDLELNRYLYTKSDNDAIEHLFNVAAGLDSLVLGEDQVIGQVKEAFRISEGINMPGTVLTRMFHKAFEAGKRVRSETAISKGITSVSSAAVEMSNTIFPDLQSKSILMIGAGQTGELAIQNLYKRGCKSIFVTNRTYSKAQEIADKYEATAFRFSELETYLEKSDIIFVAICSKTPFVTYEMAKDNLTKRKNRKQLYIDLSLPRSIDEKTAELPNAELYTIDDLTNIVKSTESKRKKAVSAAADIINELLYEFTQWLSILNLTPTIKKIKCGFHDINKSELEGFIKINSVKNRKVVEDYARHITDKYVRLLIKNVKSVTNNGNREEFIKLVNELFEMA